MKSYQKITLIYFIAGVLWIILSDLLLKNLDTSDTFYQTYKGIFFVTGTSILIYFLLRANYKVVSSNINELKKQKDIETELKRKVEENANNLHALIDASDDIIWSIDNNLKLIITNEAFRKRVTQIIGNDVDFSDPSISDHIDEKRIKYWKGHFQNALKGNSFTTTDEVFNHQTGEKEYFETSFFPLEIKNEGIIGVTCIARNVTQRKKHELLIEKNNDKLMNIAWLQSHEVRAPLTRIMGLVDLLRVECPPDKTLTEITGHIDASTKELDEMIRRVVELTYELEQEDGERESKNRN